MIDLSMLTSEEQRQFIEDDSTLMTGTVPVTLYLRYSSERQSEQSIEGQLRDCIAYCKRNQYRIADIYVDRATTARKDLEKRVNFQEMLIDSAKHQWQIVVVWKLDRFARNREDSAVSKMKLRRNGVRVESATEAISNSPEGIILESVLEGIAEYYSADLSQKITRGMRECALKCNSTGGTIPLGYKIENHKWVVDEETAPLVREAFEMYTNGEKLSTIANMFNSRGCKTSRGVPFNRSSFKTMFKNQRYIGIYKYKDIEIEGGIPAIIDKELFEKANRKTQENAHGAGRFKAKADYLLSGKLYCGHCGYGMVGESARSKGGKLYYYYICPSVKSHRGCDKRRVSKDWIENAVLQDALELLTDEMIDKMATMAVDLAEKEMRENSHIPLLNNRLKETNQTISNLLKAIEKGVTSDIVIERIDTLTEEKKALERQLEEEKKNVVIVDKSLIVYWLNKFKNQDVSTEEGKKRIINLMINSVTIWDEPDGYKITTAYNLTSQPNKTVNCSDKSPLGSPVATNPNSSIAGRVCVLTKRHFL